jgi:hypothetical protein
MRDIDHREQAQLGLKFIEDSVVNLLTRHPNGMNKADIAEVLGLRADLDPAHRDTIVSGILELLVRSGRILRGETDGSYFDNPEKS